jgi:hypothetical protein
MLAEYHFDYSKAKPNRFALKATNIRQLMMGKTEKTLTAILRGTSDANISFNDLCLLLKDLGFSERIRGDHFIYSKDGIAEILNVQPIGNKAKPYQIKQVRNLILKYKL